MHDNLALFFLSHDHFWLPLPIDSPLSPTTSQLQMGNGFLDFPDLATAATLWYDLS